MDIFTAEMAQTLVAGAAEKVIAKAAKGIVKTVKDLWEKCKTDYEIVFIDYLTGAYEKHSKVKTLIYRTEPQPITGENGFFENPYLKFGKKRFLVEGIESLYALKRQYMIIQGTGGSGKSTLMKYLFLSSLLDKGNIPIFFDLREINKIKGDYELSKIFFKKLYSLGSTLDENYMERTLDSGTYIFFLDGYDEIHSDKRDDFISKLDEYIDLYPDNYYIMSARPISDFIEMQRFTVLSIEPFELKQAIGQVEKLHYDEDVSKRFIEALRNELYDKHKSFASNPLLLCIMLLNYENYASIPAKLHVFYAEAFDTMLKRQDEDKPGFIRELKTGIEDEEYEKSFAYFCFFSYYQGKAVFSKENMKKIFDNSNFSFKVSNYLYDLTNALCVIIKDGSHYEFLHRSFQEYFTALFLKELSEQNMNICGTSLLKKNPRSLITDEVFSMLLDMAKEKMEKNILLPIFKDLEADCGERDLFHYYLRKYDGVLALINIHPEKLPEEYKLHIGSVLKNDERDFYSEIVTCLISFFIKTRYFNIPISKESKEFEKKLWSILYDESPVAKESYSIKITPAFLERNADACEYFKKTWIGQIIMCMVKFQERVMKNETDTADKLMKLLKTK